MNYIKAAIQSTGKHKARFIASTENPDRHGDIIAADGWELDTFKSNPVLLFGHSHGLPVGKVTDVFIRDKALIADVDFEDAAKIDPFADKVSKMVDAGLLNAVSVSFNPSEYESMYENDRFVGMRFTKQELLELSIVPVPANADAVRIAKSLNVDPVSLDRLFVKTDETQSKSAAAQRLKLIDLRVRRNTTDLRQ